MTAPDKPLHERIVALADECVHVACKPSAVDTAAATLLGRCASYLYEAAAELSRMRTALEEEKQMGAEWLLQIVALQAEIASLKRGERALTAGSDK